MVPTPDALVFGDQDLPFWQISPPNLHESAISSV
jgi:hypothetical protein